MPRGQSVDLCPNPRSTHTRVDRWELLALVTTLRQELGLADRDVMVLRAHLSVLPHGPLDPAGLNVSFMNITEILNRACGMDERRFRRGETRLEQVGLIHRRLSGNGRRFPERDSRGRIVSAFGIDLAPLINRYSELATMANAVRDQQRVLRQHKNRLSARLAAAIKALAAIECTLPDWVEELRHNLRKAVRRKSPPIPELNAIETEIMRVERLISHDNTSRQHPTNAPDPVISPDTSTDDAGQSVRHIESKQKKIYSCEPVHLDNTQLASIWSETKVIRQFYPQSPEHERDALQCLYEFSSFMRLDREVTGQVLATLGWNNTFVAMDYLAEKVSSIRSPTNYIRRMLDCFLRGEPIAGGQVSLPR